jgi:hypothetical protein
LSVISQSSDGRAPTRLEKFPDAFWLEFARGPGDHRRAWQPAAREDEILAEFALLGKCDALDYNFAADPVSSSALCAMLRIPQDPLEARVGNGFNHLALHRRAENRP